MTVVENCKVQFNKDVFGKMPERPLHLSVRPISVNEEYHGGDALLKQLIMDLDFGEKSGALPLTTIIPKGSTPCPAVIEIRDTVDIYPDGWLSKGYGVFSIYYGDISENNGNFKSGLSAYIAPTRRKKSSASKIAVWSWAAIRALEYAEVLSEIDKDNIGIFGKGIFALSAILAGESDSRFKFVSADCIPQIDSDFKELNPHLFSPEFIKN